MNVELPTRQFPDAFGFRAGPRSAHAGRTMMFGELRDLLEACPAGATREDYRKAVLEENVLGKKTRTARRNTLNLLSELYSLDPDVTVFRLLWHFWGLDPQARPLLALLCAAARDPLLRRTAPAVLDAREGEVFHNEALAAAVEDIAPGRYSSRVRRAIASRLASSWAQAGHLKGTRNRRRTKPAATPAAAVFALALGYLQGLRGAALLNTLWMEMLGVGAAAAGRLAAEASRRGWLNYRQAGEVIDVRFPGLFTPAEEEVLRGAD